MTVLGQTITPILGRCKMLLFIIHCLGL